MKSTFNKGSIASWIVILIWLCSAVPCIAQTFQRIYGTSLDNYFTKVIQDGSSYYVLGQDESTQTAPQYATVTRLDANGIQQWTLSLNIPSIWNDAVLTPTGDLLVVGATSPFNANNQSLMGLVTSSGGGQFSWVRMYDVVGRESNWQIIRSPNPENPSFPYYVLGGQYDPSNSSTTWDDIFLMNMDENGTFNWKKYFPSTSDDEFARDLEVMPNGDLIIAGNLGAQGIILRMNHSGILVNGVTPDGLSFSYADVAPESAGGYYAVGSTFPSFQAHLMKYDISLLSLWDATITFLTGITQVWEDPTNGDIYVTGRGVFNGLTRAVVLRLIEVGNAPSLQWVKFLDNGETIYTGGATSYLPPNQIAFADGRFPSSGGFGEHDAFISISDLDLQSCMTSEDIVDVDAISLVYSAPFVPDIDFFAFSTGTDVNGSILNWQQEEVCIEPCQADFVIVPVGACGHYEVFNTSTGVQPLTYLWCNGSTTENLNVTLPCGPHTFCLTITAANGCTSSISQTITVTDNIPPVAICVPAFGVTLNTNCEFLVTPALIDGGSSDNCQIQSLSVSPALLSGCGNFPITLTVTDWCGNTNSCVTNIQTHEDIPPVIICPPSVFVTSNNTSPCSVLVNGLSWLSATDNCGSPFVDYVVSGATSNFGQNDASGLTYNEGVSTIVYTATDDCGNTNTCVLEVIVSCKDTCYCGTFSDMVIRFERGPGTPLTCGGPPVLLSCPPSGYVYTLTGKFQCQGSGCPPNAPLDAQLEQPNGTILSLGSQQANPYFGIPVSNLLLQQSGVYTLILTGHCGSQTCTCVLKFIIDPPCTDPCPCDISDIQAFGQAVNLGFASVLSTHSCKACFTPLALTECETIEWYLNTTGGVPIGTSTGGNSFCHQFPGSGTYTVIMVVTRKKADGTNCETFVKSQTVTITCLLWDECLASIFDNPSFGEGAVEGDLDSGGRSSGWKKMKPAQPKTEAEKRTGSFDGWAIGLFGNLESSGILTTIDPVCMHKDTGLITVRIAVNDSGVQIAKKAAERPCDRLALRLFRGDNFELDITNCAGIDCYTLAFIPLSDLDTGWHELQIPYDLRRWLALDGCGIADGVLIRPAIYVTNALMSNQGGEDTYSTAQLDNFCIDNTIVSVHHPQVRKGIRLYPNPNRGDFSIELPEPAKQGMSVNVINLAGQTVMETPIDSDRMVQKISMISLHQGMYFVQILLNGKLIAVNKMVIQ